MGSDPIFTVKIELNCRTSRSCRRELLGVGKSPTFGDKSEVFCVRIREKHRWKTEFLQLSILPLIINDKYFGMSIGHLSLFLC